MKKVIVKTFPTFQSLVSIHPGLIAEMNQELSTTSPTPPPPPPPPTPEKETRTPTLPAPPLPPLTPEMETPNSPETTSLRQNAYNMIPLESDAILSDPRRATKSVHRSTSMEVNPPTSPPPESTSVPIALQTSQAPVTTSALHVPVSTAATPVDRAITNTINSVQAMMANSAVPLGDILPAAPYYYVPVASP